VNALRDRLAALGDLELDDLEPDDRVAVGAEPDLLDALTDDGISPIERAALVLVVECAALVWLAQEPQRRRVTILRRPTDDTGTVALTDPAAGRACREHTLFAGAARSLGWGGVNG